jgi:hypothetical protein
MTAPISAVSAMSFPQVAGGLSAGERGVCSLRWGADVLRFRTNPNEFNWQYALTKRIENTYGGRVVQLLGTKIDEFTLKADAGGGRWEYMNRIATFCRDVMIHQRNGVPATLDYTTRGWRLNVYVVSVPFADAVEEVLREFEIVFKVQQDVSGTMSRQTLSAELARLRDGIGFQRSKYNDPRLQGGNTVADQEQSIAATTVDALVSGLGGLLGYVNNPFLPGTAVPSSISGTPGTVSSPAGISSLPGIGMF